MNSHNERLIDITSQYATDFAAKMQLGKGIEQKCEWLQRYGELEKRRVRNDCSSDSEQKKVFISELSSF
jgi:hypothetical protein